MRYKVITPQGTTVFKSYKEALRMVILNERYYPTNRIKVLPIGLKHSLNVMWYKLKVKFKLY